MDIIFGLIVLGLGLLVIFGVIYCFWDSWKEVQQEKKEQWEHDKKY